MSPQIRPRSIKQLELAAGESARPPRNERLAVGSPGPNTMSVSAIQGTLTDPAARAAAANRSPVQTLNQDQFLQLLVAQLTSQDPLNPKQDTDFIAQMAQFTGLEQTKSMQQDIAAMHSEQ